MYRKFNLLLSIVLLMALFFAPAGSAAAQTAEPVVKGSVATAVAPNLIVDPSLEAAYGNDAIWKQGSSNADTPLCKPSNPDCLTAEGVAGPRTGTKWAMFGGIDWEDPESIHPEEGYLYQNVTFPGCGASLQFYFWIGRAPAGSGVDDLFDVWIDNVKIFSKNATHAAAYSSYALVTLDVSDYADGAVHKVEFHSVTDDESVVFNLDDISLTRTCVTISGNAGVAGATLDYVDGSTASDGSGNYSFNVPFDWSGTVTPSKTAYTFSPVNRPYANLATDKPAQNYTATPITYTISGNVGVAGVALHYTDGIDKTAISQADGNYSFVVSYNWSGTVTPSHTCYTFDPIDRDYTDVLADQPVQDYAPTEVPGAGCTNIIVKIGGVDRGTFSISSQGTVTQSPFRGLSAGPVEIKSTVPIFGAERVIYKVNGVNTSFSEMVGLPNGQLDTIYWLPWYNNKTLNTQLRLANPSDSQSASVDVTIGGTPVPGSPFTLNAGASIRKTFTGIDNGPVKIVSTIPIVAAERVIYKVNGVDTSFSEMMAMPDSQLDSIYWLPWHNNKTLNTQLRFANPSPTEQASVTITIGGTPVPGSPFTLDAGKSIRKTFTGIDNGPVKIVSTIPIVAAERVIYKVNGVDTSFSEMMAMPDGQLDTVYWFARYNNSGDLNTQLRFANPSDSQPASVTVTIGGNPVAGSPFTLDAGKSIRKSFGNINGGLVKVESDIPIIVAERVIYRVNGVDTSFSEIMGLPDGQLDLSYWLPWYNNIELDTVLRFGIP